jgi:hypothetical protein
MYFMFGPVKRDKWSSFGKCPRKYPYYDSSRKYPFLSEWTVGVKGKGAIPDHSFAVGRDSTTQTLLESITCDAVQSGFRLSVFR